MKKDFLILFAFLLVMPVALQAQLEFDVFDMRSGLPETRVRALCQMPDGRMAIATAGTITIYDGTRFHVCPLRPENAYSLIDYHGLHHLVGDSLGLVWLRNNRCLYVVDALRLQPVHDIDSLLAARHLSAQEVSRWPAGEEWRNDEDFFKVHSLVTEEITAIVRDSYGGLWVGLKESGLLYSNPSRKRQFQTTDETFPYNALYPFCSPRASQLSTRYASSATNCTLDGRAMTYTYLGTRDGVMVIDHEDQLVATFDERDGLSTNNVVALLADRRGDVWAATADGLTRIRQTGRDSFDIVNYGLHDGIDTRGCEIRTCQMHLDSTGLVSVGFVGGTVKFHPDSVTVPRYTFHFPRVASPTEQEEAFSLFRYWWVVLLFFALVVIFIRMKSRVSKSPSMVLPPQCADGKESVGETMAHDIAQQSAEKHLLPSDLEFLDRLKAIISQHIADEDFSVQSLSEMMAMDRSVLYRRMQTLTGVSPSVYVKNIRMDIARRLLRDSDLSISDIAMKTGFATTKYFSASFKDSFGLTPSEFRAQKQG